jgi:drug/metabolite transporter (DMT)-like permease
MNYTPYLKFLSQIVNEAVAIFLLVGAAFGLVVGLMLVLDSARAFRIGDRLNRWVSTRAAVRPLEEHHSIARPLYRMHRLVGMLICAGALYALAVLGTPAGKDAVVKSLGTLGSPAFAAWIAESLRVVLLVGNAAAFVFGVLFIVRPSSLKRLEAWADRRVSGRKASKPLEVMRDPTDRFVREHPRMVGGLVIAGSLYVLLQLGVAVLPTLR